MINEIRLLRNLISICMIFILFSLISYHTNAQSGAALNFDGIDDYVDCGNNTSVQITGSQITLEAWIKPAAWQTNSFQGSIINKELNSSNGGYMLRCGNNGQLSFAFSIGGTWVEIQSASGAMTLNNWYHVCGTYDGTTQSLYINGILVGYQPVSGSIVASTMDLYIGNSQSNPSRLFTGTIDEVRVWNVAKPRLR